MGIQDLKRFLRENGLITEYKYSKLRNRRIAIDISCWIYKTSYVIAKDILSKETSPEMSVDMDLLMRKLKKSLISFANSLLSKKIVPVFVFDGAPPEEKKDVKEKRKKDIEKRNAKINEIRSSDVLDLTNLRRLLCNNTRISHENTMKIMRFIDSLGIATMLASGEAEKLCTSLCIEGKCVAVLSSDTDNLPMGCPLVLFSMLETGFECCLLSSVLSKLSMSMDSFRDFCIMSGCDYNSRIKGIGVKTSYKLMKKYKSIEQMALHYRDGKLDIRVLNHIKCRELMLYEKSSSISNCSNVDLLRDQIDKNMDDFQEQGLGKRVLSLKKKMDKIKDKDICEIILSKKSSIVIID